MQEVVDGKRRIKICTDCWDDVCRGYERNNPSAVLFLGYCYPYVTYVSPEECEVCGGKRRRYWIDEFKRRKR